MASSPTASDLIGRPSWGLPSAAGALFFTSGLAAPSEGFPMPSKFQRPAFVDLFSGDVYAISEEAISREGERITFHALPLYDSPILVAENSVLNLAS